jgi:glucose/arabinose dehydrogenase/mono/diheme cytochrome c family protein
MRRKIVLLVLGIIGLGVLGLAGVGTVTLVRQVSRSATSDTPPAYLIQPPGGFEVSVYAEPANMSLPTVITFGPDGHLYLLTLGGHLLRLEDSDGDFYAETVQTLYDNADGRLVQPVGLAFHDDALYISHSGSISTFSDDNGDGTLDTLTPIVEGLVSLHFRDHSNNGIIFGPDDRLYVGVGAKSDHGPVTDPMEGVILRMNPDGSDLEVFASGFRNPYDVAISPDGEVFTADNNPSEFDDTLRFLPPEELNHVREGRNYGFPDVYGRPPADNDSEPPVTEFYPSVGSAGIVYYDGDQFPEHYQQGVFVAQWGTGANIALDRGITNGQMIVFVPLEPSDDGTFTGDWEVFAQFNPDNNLRPVDVTVGPDGALYVVEFQTATIYRISYTGETTATQVVSEEPVPEFAAEVVSAGEALYLRGAEGAPPCVTCHMLDERRGLGPSLRGLRNIAGSRVSGLSAVEYVRQSIVDANAYIVPGYNADYMYQGYGDSLSDEQVEALVAFVLSLET